MGNRAIVSFDGETTGVYLHWNGGPESVLAFLKVMEERKWTRMDYASARFTAVVSEFFDADGGDQGLSLGILENKHCGAADGDNGVYEVSRDGDAFAVEQDGKIINYNTLNKREKEQHDGIVDCLARVRSARTKAAVSA